MTAFSYLGGARKRAAAPDKHARANGERLARKLKRMQSKHKRAAAPDEHARANCERQA